MYHLVSFADSRMRPALHRLKMQAKEMELFESIHLLNESSLSIEFRKRFKDKLVFGSRGYGYWSWKPEVILNGLSRIGDGELLLYIDAGCHLNPLGKSRLLQYFEHLMRESNGILAFQANPPGIQNSTLKYDGRRLPDQANYRWIKGDVLDYFNVREDPGIVNAQAIGAGIILIRKCDNGVNIIKEWQKTIWERFDLLDDSPSSSTDLKGFLEHRHDQAIFTLICMKYRIKTLSAYEYWYPKKNCTKMSPDWHALKEFPIHARRDKNMGVLRTFFHKVNLLRLRLKSL